MLHAVGFALGATVEETLALASARGDDPGSLPDEPGPVRSRLLDALPSHLREIVLLGWEGELWRRAARDPRWDAALCSALGYRANQYLLDERYDEVVPIAQRAVRLASTPESRHAAVPAVGALLDLAERRGEGPADAARTAGEWTERLEPSVFKPGWRGCRRRPSPASAGSTRRRG